jgi:hypothetical protein
VKRHAIHLKASVEKFFTFVTVVMQRVVDHFSSNIAFFQVVFADSGRAGAVRLE